MTIILWQQEVYGIIIEINNGVNENNDAGNYGINNGKTTTSKSFEYNAKIIGRTINDNNKLDTEVVE